MVTPATDAEQVADDLAVIAAHVRRGETSGIGMYNDWYKVEDEPKVDSDSEQPDLVRMYITFGVQYAREPHPSFPAAHPSGYFVIEAPTQVACRELAVLLFNRHWAFDYTEAEFDPSYHPMGELGRISTRSFFNAG
jgi:hypothetical protein